MHTLEHKALLHPTTIKKLKTFLEVENKMGPIPTLVVNLDPHNHTLTPISEKTMSQKRGREPLPRKSSDQQPSSLPQSAHLCQRPHQNTPSVLVRESTPWPGTGKMSGNLFDNRNWLIPQNYLPSKDKEENAMGITSPKPPIKESEPKINEQSSEKCRWGPDALFVKVRKREEKKTKLSKS